MLQQGLATVVRIQLVRRLKRSGKFASLSLPLALHLDDVKFAMFRVQTRPLLNHDPRGEVEDWENQSLSHLIVFPGLIERALGQLFSDVRFFLSTAETNELQAQLVGAVRPPLVHEHTVEVS